MARYLHLYFSYIKRSFISRMEYKKDTFIAMMGFLIENAASLASLYFIVSAIPSLGGWSIYQIGFLYGFMMLPRGIDHFFSDELWLVAYRRVKMGDMDAYYLRPLPILFQVLAETVQPDAFGELIVGIAMTILCGIATQVQLNFGLILLLIVAAIFGAIITTSLKIMMSSLAFIFKRSGPVLQIVYNFMDYSRYPIGIYPKFIKIFLMTIIPFGLIISLPIETIYFGGYNPYLLCLVIIGVAIVFLSLAILVWSACARRYESTGN